MGNDVHTRVELVESDTELAEAGEELRFDLAMNRVVDTLVDRGLDIALRLADADNLGDLPPKVSRHVNTRLPSS